MSIKAAAWLIPIGVLICLTFFAYPYWVVYWPAPFFVRYGNPMWAAIALGLGIFFTTRFKSVYGRTIWQAPKPFFKLLGAAALFSWMVLYALTGVCAALAMASAKPGSSRCAQIVKYSPGPDTLFSRPHKITLRYSSNGETDDVQFFYRRDAVSMGEIFEGGFASVSGKNSPFGFIVEGIQPTSQCQVPGSAKH